MQAIEYIFYNLVMFGGLYCLAKTLEYVVQYAIDETQNHDEIQASVEALKKRRS